RAGVHRARQAARCCPHRYRPGRPGQGGPMSELFNFPPFNMPASEGWVFLYLMMAGGVLFFTHPACVMIGAALDRRATPEPAQPGSLGGGAYRSPGRVGHHDRLAIGTIPHEDEVYLIAYMRGGTNAVAEVLAGRAISEGYLVDQNGGLERAAVLPDDLD